ncbi:COP9 signalosome complex subunit 3 [Frankliniella fusca]|uniref:COP9 signalosome complex subunit 3 n=1 Tax=Frankliniella fusca TaxID=407009 RepID=A0AAE1H3B3_9NEOP|nr:COP9 signalosome complex subunit 3 [Frankliniella fusca]KAK3928159.1 COP9 signalosome complex subunit 3 [Frankliniella fusca]
MMIKSNVVETNLFIFLFSGNYSELCDVLSKSTEVLSKNLQHLDNVLETLDTHQHSLGVLAVLFVKTSNLPGHVAQGSGAPESVNHAENKTHDSLIFNQFQNFVDKCDSTQIRLAPETYSEVCHVVTKILIDQKRPHRGIDLLRRAIRKLQKHESQLTGAHADLMQLCLLAKNFKPALEFLDVDICSISDEGSQSEAKYFLLYFYYGAMIYTAVKKFDRALYFLEVVITTPAMAVSHIMLEAYKKYILVCLILHGKVLNPPKYTSQVIERFIKPLSSAYHKLSLAYNSNSCEEVQQCLTLYAETFNRDGNNGLAKQVLASLRKKNIQRLTKTFLTLSLSDVASRVQLPSPRDAEKAILNMIEDGEIFASINQKDGMVFFHDDPEKFNTPAALKRLEEEMERCTELDRKILEMDEKFLVNPAFIKKQQSGATEDDIALAPAISGQGSSTFTM